MPAEHRSDWLRAASKEFQSARADYEQRIDLLAEARERLAQEAALVSFLVDGQMSSIHMGMRVRVHVGGVEGLVREVPVADVVDALRNEWVELEMDALFAVSNG